MNTIIALQGPGGKGKTTTIRLLHELLNLHGYHCDSSTFRPVKGDFIATFSKKGKKIGVTSSGDSYQVVHDHLEKLTGKGCEICICACRTKDRNPRGTIAAIREFTLYTPVFIPKTIDNNLETRRTSNERDADTLLARIETLL